MKPRIAYLMSRFPKISETFILTEMLELQRLGASIDVFPLLRQKEAVRHPEVDSMLRHTHYRNVFSWAVLSAQFYWLRKSRRAYWEAWKRALSGNRKSPGFLIRAFWIVPMAASFARTIEDRKIQHVHCHWATHPALAAYVIKLLAGIPYSFTAHAHDIYANRTMLEEKIRESNFVVTISEYNRRLLSELYGDVANSKVNVIHCGVDPEHFKPGEHKRGTPVFRILCIASLEERKGQAYLLEACAQLKEKGVPFRCMLVGDGVARPVLEAKIRKLKLNREVQMMGWQPRDHVKTLLSVADVVVLPSTITTSGRTEGIPVSIMEAMAMQVPVVVTNVSGIPELVRNGESGIVVPDRDAAALMHALNRLYKRPRWAATLARNARVKVQEEFNLHKSAALLFQRLKAETSRYEPPAAVAASALDSGNVSVEAAL